MKFHVLFPIRAMISWRTKQPTMVIEPRYTVSPAEGASDFLPMAATCLENALQTALNQAQIDGKVFSPQNWLKTNASVQAETLVAGTVAGMLPSFPNGPAILGKIKAPPGAFSTRLSAE